MTEVLLINYTCPECNVSELIAAIIPKKSCEKCGVLMDAEELE